MRNRLKRWLLMTSGCTSLVLGIVGIFLPILPTTPFLLLSAFCFSRSSTKLHRFLLSNRCFGTYLENYQKHKSIPLKTKVVVLAMLWITIGITIVRAFDHFFPRILLAGVAIGVTIHVLSLKSHPKNSDWQEDHPEFPNSSHSYRETSSKPDQ